MTAKADSSAFVEKLGREPLRWTEPRRPRCEWELYSGDQIVATLIRSRGIRTLYGRAPMFTAKSPGGEWEIFQRWTGVDLRRAGEVTPLIELRGLFLMVRSRVRVTAVGDEFAWRIRPHLWRHSTFELLNSSEFPLLRMAPRRTGMHCEGTLTLEDTGRRYSGIEPLTILAWALGTAWRRRERRFVPH